MTIPIDKHKLKQPGRVWRRAGSWQRSFGVAVMYSHSGSQKEKLGSTSTQENTGTIICVVGVGCLLSVFEKQSSLHRIALLGNAVIYDKPDAYLGVHVGRSGSELRTKHSRVQSILKDMRVLLSPRRNRKSPRRVVETGCKLEQGVSPVMEKANYLRVHIGISVNIYNSPTLPQDALRWVALLYCTLAQSCSFYTLRRPLTCNVLWFL